MKIVKNTAFRIFLYILGFAAVLLIFVSGIVSLFRYGVFSRDDDFSKPYILSDSVKDGIRNDLLSMQESASNKQKTEEFDVSDKTLQIIDYSDIRYLVRSNYFYPVPNEENEYVDIEDEFDVSYLDPQKKTVGEMLGQKNVYERLSSYVFGDNSESPNIYNAFDGVVPYNSDKDGAVTFLRMTWSEYLELVKSSCDKYNYEEYSSDSYELDSTYTITYSDDSEDSYEEDDYEESTEVNGVMVVSEYQGEPLKDYLINNLCDGDYYKMIGDDLYIYSPTSKLVTFDKYGTANVIELNQGDYVYFVLTDEILELIYGVAGPNYDFSLPKSENFDRLILSSYMYRTEVEAIYSVLDQETRSMLTDMMTHSYYYSFGSDLAYSFNNTDVADSRVFSGDNELISLSNTENYEAFVNRMAQKSDIFVQYNSRADQLVQWYRDENGDTHPYEFVTQAELDQLVKTCDESFVLGLDIYSQKSIHYEDQFAYSVCRLMRNPALFLCLAVIILGAVIVVLTVGEPPRLLLVDRAPYIVWLALYAALVTCFLLLANVMYKSGSIVFDFGREQFSFFAIITMILLMLYVATASVYMTFIRRVKANKFWDGFLLVRFIRWFFRTFGKFAHSFPGKLRGFVLIIGCTIVNVLALTVLTLAIGEPEPLLLLVVLIAIEIGVVIYLLKYMSDMDKLLNTSRRLEQGELDAKVDPDSLHLNAREMGNSLNNLGAGLQKAVDASLRDERTKAELITNVSHDIKTPLTSIISYIDLLKREDIDNEKALEYINVLDKKSERLKQLILDLIEASKTSTGNIELECMNLSLSELLNQCLGEHEEKMNELGLEVVKTLKAQESLIYADGRRVFRVIDNLLNNVEKYAQPNTRVFIDMKDVDGKVVCTMKNTSREMLNISADELMERFVRGDRSRNTEGSGLGLSIARNLTELQNGTFDISIDGDHFKVEIAFPLVQIPKVEEPAEAEETAEADETVEPTIDETTEGVAKDLENETEIEATEA